MSLGPFEILIIVYLALFLFLGGVIFRDAKKNALPTPAAITWAIASVITFPIGTLAYFLLARPSSKRQSQAPTGDIAGTQPVVSRTRSFARRFGGLVTIIVYLLLVGGTNLYGQGYFCFSSAREVDPISVQWQKGIGACFDGEFLWVANDSKRAVQKVDTSTGEVLATVGINGRAWGMAYDGEYLWVSVNLGSSGGELCKINAKTLKATTYENRTVNPEYSGALCFDGKYLWGGMDGVCKICRANGVVINDWILSSSPLPVVFDGKSIWSVENEFQRIDPASGKITYSSGPVAVGPGGSLLFDGEDIWYYVYDYLYFLDIDSEGNPGQVETYRTDVSGGGMVTDGSYIWISDRQSGRVDGFDIRTRQPTRTTIIDFVTNTSVDSTLAYDGIDVWFINRANGEKAKLIR